MPSDENERKKLLNELNALRDRVEELENSSPGKASRERSADFFRCLIAAIPDLIWLKDQEEYIYPAMKPLNFFWSKRRRDSRQY